MARAAQLNTNPARTPFSPSTATDTPPRAEPASHDETSDSHGSSEAVTVFSASLGRLMDCHCRVRDSVCLSHGSVYLSVFTRPLT